jgi:hypothetical protein
MADGPGARVRAGRGRNLHHHRGHGGGRRAARSKIRTRDDLMQALAKLGCGEADVPDPVSDHAADALITAAWMRAHGGDEALWHPAALTPILAQTEGWTFGVA